MSVAAVQNPGQINPEQNPACSQVCVFYICEATCNVECTLSSFRWVLGLLFAFASSVNLELCKHKFLIPLVVGLPAETQHFKFNVKFYTQHLVFLSSWVNFKLLFFGQKRKEKKKLPVFSIASRGAACYFPLSNQCRKPGHLNLNSFVLLGLFLFVCLCVCGQQIRTELSASVRSQTGALHYPLIHVTEKRKKRRGKLMTLSWEHLFSLFWFVSTCNSCKRMQVYMYSLVGQFAFLSKTNEKVVVFWGTFCKNPYKQAILHFRVNIPRQNKAKTCAKSFFLYKKKKQKHVFVVQISIRNLVQLRMTNATHSLMQLRIQHACQWHHNTRNCSIWSFYFQSHIIRRMLSAKHKKRICRYIDEDNRQKFKSYVRKHKIDVCSSRMPNSGSVLHHVCQKGADNILR